MMPLWGGGIIGRSYDTQTAEQPDDFGEIIDNQSSPMISEKSSAFKAAQWIR
jgi:hypothetical protein